MKQVQLNDSGDLHINLKEHDEDNIIVYRLSNDSEIEFVDDECVAFVLPFFEQKLNRGHIDRETVSLQDYWLEGDTAFFYIDIDLKTTHGVMHETVHAKINLSSLKDKV